MIIPTNHPAFLVREWGKSLTPLLYPFQNKRKQWIEIRSCSVSYSPNKPQTFDAKFARVLKCALAWLDNEDMVCRRQLAKRGPDWKPREIPDVEFGPLSMLPNEYFDTEDIYG